MTRQVTTTVTATTTTAPNPHRFNWAEGIPLLGYHLGCLGLIWVGWSWPAAIAAVAAYWTMIFGVSIGYHRYFAHRSFKTSRVFQFALAWVGAVSAQMGPLWWSCQHRRHHRFADQERDVHSPTLKGFLYSHVGWILREEYIHTDPNEVRDWIKFPELVWLDRLRYLPPLSLALGMFGLGWWLEIAHPGSGATRWQMLTWGCFVATTVMYHVTFCVNSFNHLFGRRAFETRDNSRNLWWVALLTNGEGWHNNHHRYPSAARQGFQWWEIDVSLYTLRLLERLGLVWDLREPPAQIYRELRERRAGQAVRRQRPAA